nr:hypothetical protein [uncultured Cohaesibacter sp.]
MVSAADNQKGLYPSGSKGGESFLWNVFMPKQLVVTCLMCLCIGLAVYLYRQQIVPDRYLSQTKILLMTPQEQYIPYLNLSATKQSLDQQNAMADDVIKVLPVQKYLDNPDSNIEIKRDKEKRVINIAVKALNPQLASNVANDLAERFLASFAKRRNATFNKSVRELEAEIEHLSSRIQKNASSDSTNSDLPNNQQGLAIAEHQGKDKMIALLQLRETEMKTLASLNLVPPAARILSRATAQARPVDKHALLWAAMASLMAFMVRLCLLMFNKRQGVNVGSRFEGRLTTDTLPHEVRLACPVPEQLPVLPSSDVQTFATARCAIASNGEGFSEDLPPFAGQKAGLNMDAGVIEEVSCYFSQMTHGRIALVAPEVIGSDLGIGLAKRFLEQRAAAYLCLDRNFGASCDDQQRNGLFGISDFLDGKARFEDFIDIEWTSALTIIGRGHRHLCGQDFLSSQFQTFLIALEAAYDFLIIDMGQNCENEAVLRSLAADGQAIAMVCLPSQILEDGGLVHEAFMSLGFKDSLIITDLGHENACAETGADYRQAAE